MSPPVQSALALEPLYRIRLAGREAWPWALATWIRTYAFSDFARPIPPGIYRRVHHALALRLLEVGDLHVASPLDEPGVFCGWALRQPGVLHFAYVKPEFRGLGIGAELLEGAGPVYTHKLNDPDISIPSGWQYNPYQIA